MRGAAARQPLSFFGPEPDLFEAHVFPAVGDFLACCHHRVLRLFVGQESLFLDTEVII